MTLTQILSKLKSLVYSKTETDTLLGNKAASSHTHSDYVPKDGTTSITGTAFFKSTSDSQLQIGSGTSTTTGGCFVAYGSEYSNSELAGSFRLRARTTTNYDLQGLADGRLLWNNKNLAMQEDTIPRSGGEVLDGRDYKRTVDNDVTNLYGCKGYGHGAFIQLTGKDDSGAGEFNILAHDGTNAKLLKGKANGALTWDSKNVAMQEDTIPRSGGAVMQGGSLRRNVDDNEFRIDGGSDWNKGSSVVVYGKDHRLEGRIYFHPSNGSNEKSMYLYPNGTWTWSGTAVQITSDQRLKQQISEIDDKLLDAWEDVLPCQFKYNDAVDQKGDTARLHTGYVVQQIDEACKSHNLDISAYGLYCHEEYPEETEEVEVEQEDGTKIKERKVIREASEHYSLRYTETLVVECAFLRREVKRLSERLSKLEQPSTSEK